MLAEEEKMLGLSVKQENILISQVRKEIFGFHVQNTFSPPVGSGGDISPMYTIAAKNFILILKYDFLRQNAPFISKERVEGRGFQKLGDQMRFSCPVVSERGNFQGFLSSRDLISGEKQGRGFSRAENFGIVRKFFL